MAKTLEINAIRDYLIEVGYKIEYPILVNAFKKHLYNPDPNVQAKVRTQFKDYVNKLATVSLENNMKFILLRPEFRPDNNPSNGLQHQLYQIKNEVLEKSPLKPPNIETNKQQYSPKVLTKQITQPQHQQPIYMPTSPPRAINNPIISAAHSTPPPVPQHQKQTNNNGSTNGFLKQQLFQQNSNQSFGQPLSQPLPLSVQAHSNNDNIQRQQQSQILQQQQQNFIKHNIPINHNSMHMLSLSDSSSTNSIGSKHDVQDGNILMPPPIAIPPSITRKNQQQQQHQYQLQTRPESLNLSTSNHMPPPRPPPRRRQSNVSLFKQSPKPIEKSREIQDLAKKSPGRVKEHALKLNSSASTSDLKALMPIRSNTMKENRLSRDSTIGSLSSALQRNGLQLTSRSRSSHREDESDSSSLQPIIDPLRRKWAIEACNCNYNGLLTLLREDHKLAYYKDIVNGYTALHWAAKFGNLDIIKLIAGTHGVSANIKSSAGYTPLHVAAMFNRDEAADLLLKSYKANPDIRDHSGKRAKQYWPKQDLPKTTITTTKTLTPFKH